MSIDIVDAIVVGNGDNPVDCDLSSNEERLPRAIRCPIILPSAFATPLLEPLPENLFDLARQAFLRYFDKRLLLCGTLPESDLISFLKVIQEEHDSFLINARVRRKAKIARDLLLRMLRYEGINDHCQFLLDLAFFINEDRSEQGFSLPPFTLFVHKTKGFSRFSTVLQEVAQAVMDEAIATNPDFPTLMQKNLSGIDDSIEVTTHSIDLQQENIKKESSEVLKKIDSINASCREKLNAEASPPLDRQKVNQIKEDSFKEISGLNRKLAAFVGSVNQTINQLKKDLRLMTGMKGIFSTFIEYLSRKNSESISPTPSV